MVPYSASSYPGHFLLQFLFSPPILLLQLLSPSQNLVKQCLSQSLLSTNPHTTTCMHLCKYMVPQEHRRLLCCIYTCFSLQVRPDYIHSHSLPSTIEIAGQLLPVGITVIESIVLPSLSGLIVNPELLTEEVGPGTWYYSVAVDHLPSLQ